MKKQIKRLFAFVLALTLIFSLAACNGDEDSRESSTAESGQEAALPGGATGDVSEDGTQNPDESSPDQTDPTQEQQTDASGQVVSTQASGGQAPAISGQRPSTPAQIIKLYNDSVTGAYNSKVGFKKNRTTGNETMDSNPIFNMFKDVIYGFIGIGEENVYNETVTKGQWDSDSRRQYLRASTLGTGDITDASCTQSGANYILTMKVKPGTTYATKGVINNNAPLDKCGICVGDEDKHYYDHKRASVIYDAIDEVYGNAKVSEQYTNAVITATINASNGRLVRIVIKFDISVNVDLGALGSPTATGSTTVTYSDFKY